MEVTPPRSHGPPSRVRAATNVVAAAIGSEAARRVLNYATDVVVGSAQNLVMEIGNDYNHDRLMGPLQMGAMDLSPPRNAIGTSVFAAWNPNAPGFDLTQFKWLKHPSRK